MNYEKFLFKKVLENKLFYNPINKIDKFISYLISKKNKSLIKIQN